MSANYDQKELDKFSALSMHWWDETGPLKTLHQINPIRMEYLASKVSFLGKKVVDIGCGGGLLTEALAKQGAIVTGIDMSTSVIQTAMLHLYESKLDIEYRNISSTQLAEEAPMQYDVVTCLEMLEHVPDPLAIIKDCFTLLKPDGAVFFSTINRNLKAYIIAILGAEYALKVLPIHTHDYDKFIKPSELSTWCRTCKLTPIDIKGIKYSPFSDTFSLSDDVAVNYLLYAKRE